ncbi:hypothetical protein [Selenihalanaerobacter shriftii]|uniref:Uncharacterized protein n=1 Tax=Selenihalanaerobacter shriftii TaxID=142842 RepID=A0A1T4JK89_9FIRM|nr:hypothetical protein [Selenihalanaerobacter shriftii]SJZ30600.1 hypothetical protein SAMN02745118_00089 [Selenihalanaerobacter shriftii]
MPFEDQLLEQIGDYVAVIITAGGGCCRHEGILCSVMADFITLINNNVRVEIPIESIAAVRKLAGGAPIEEVGTLSIETPVGSEINEEVNEENTSEDEDTIFDFDNELDF